MRAQQPANVLAMLVVLALVAWVIGAVPFIVADPLVFILGVAAMLAAVWFVRRP